MHSSEFDATQKSFLIEASLHETLNRSTLSNIPSATCRGLSLQSSWGMQVVQFCRWSYLCCPEWKQFRATVHYSENKCSHTLLLTSKADQSSACKYCPILK